MDSPNLLALVEVITVGAFVVIGTATFGAIYYFLSFRHKQARERASAELPQFNELGLTFRESDRPDEIGTLAGTYHEYDVKVTPDEYLRLLVTLKTNSKLDIDIGTGLRAEGSLQFRRADVLVDEALSTRETVHGQGLNESSAAALRSYLRQWGPQLCYFRLLEHRLGLSPRKGTSRHVRSINATQIRQLLPPLVELAEALDEGNAADVKPKNPKKRDIVPASYRQAPNKPSAPLTASFDDDPINYGREFLGPTADELGGAIMLLDHGAVCAGEIEGRNFQVLVMKESGGVEAKVSVKGEVPCAQIYCDPDEAHDDMTPIGEHLYLCADDETTLDGLPSDELEAIKQLMKDQRIFRLSVDDEHIEIELLVVAKELDRDATPVIVRRLAHIATAFEDSVRM